jgi:mycofactocin precursor
MRQQSSDQEEVPMPDTATAPPEPPPAAPEPVAPPLDESLVEDELLVEDVSIDGMCGVY